jgi:hypothetical protein
LLCATSFAQVQTGIVKYQPHAFGIEMSYGLGISNERYDDTYSFGLDASIRYTWNFIPYVGWDVIKLKFSTNNEFEQIAYINALSGIRFATPRFGQNKTTHFYTAFRFGAAYYKDYFTYNYVFYHPGNEFGFTWECDLGIHLKHFFVNIKYSSLNARHYVGFGLGADIGKFVERKKNIK